MLICKLEMIYLQYNTKWEFDGFGLIPRGTPIRKRTNGPVLGAQTHGEPKGKTAHRWPGVPKTRARTHGETHIEEAALRAASTKKAAAFVG